MRVWSRLPLALTLAAFVAAPAVLAADPAPAAKPQGRTGTTERLFLSFAQDAAIAPSQWWEGQIEYDDGSQDIPVDAFIVRGVVAFQPVKNLEVGGSFGLGNTNADPSLPDGTGATDLNLYGKWMFPNAAAKVDFTAGLLATVPTGDDTAGLGFNSFGAQAFGAMRYTMEGAIIGGHVGARFNGDGQLQGFDLPGKTSYELGVCALFPLANQVTIVAEGRIETARFEGFDSSAELLGGINWKAFNRGMLRGAIAGGLTDGSPNVRVILGYAYTF